MTVVNVTASLNQRVRCPECGSCASWHRTGRADARANSTLFRFRCSRCGEQVFVKLARLHGRSTCSDQNIEKEYQTLLGLQAVFPSDSPCGALTPIDYLKFDGYGAMITRRFHGDDLGRYVRSADVDELRPMYRSAGTLLRVLHDACPDGDRIQTLAVEPKLEYLNKTYGGLLRSNPKVRDAFILLHESALRIAQPAVRWTWVHGDFKPENVLYDGRSVIVLDTQLGSRGAFVYDIASFLDHVLLAGHAIGGGKILRQYQRIETEFLAGYGGLGKPEIAALRWAQLYFMLCYFGRYAKRGVFARIYADRRIGTLTQNIAGQLACA